MGEFHGHGRSQERRCRRIAEWPEDDSRAWTASLNRGDLIDGSGARAKYRAISNRKVEHGYGRWLTFLDRRGWLKAIPPEERITEVAVVTYVQEMQAFKNSSHTILARLQELYEAAMVMDSGRDWRWIRRVASQIRAVHKPARNKRSKMVSTADLLQLGMDLMHRAKWQSTARLQAITFRDGLIIAFASLRPLRLKNLASIELGRHLSCGRGNWKFQFPAEEIKNGGALEFTWPEILVESLESWLGRWRPVLCNLRSRWARAVGDSLWVSSHGSPLTMQAIYDRLVAQTTTAFGHPVNPHLFRDVAATTLADVDPEHVRIAAPLLGHRDFRTTERYYLHANMMKATRRYQQELLRVRHGWKE